MAIETDMDVLNGLIPAVHEDEPLPNIMGFKKLAENSTKDQVRQLCKWIDMQRTCTSILKHHGPKGLHTVLQGIAAACDAHDLPKWGRVGSYAG